MVSATLKEKAFDRSGGYCENCHKQIVRDNHREGE